MISPTSFRWAVVAAAASLAVLATAAALPAAAAECRRGDLDTRYCDTDGDLLADETMAAGTLPGLYVSAVTVEPRGAWPLALAGHYYLDSDHIADYVRLAASDEGFAQYAAAHIRAAAAP